MRPLLYLYACVLAVLKLPVPAVTVAAARQQWAPMCCASMFGAATSTC